MLYHQRFAYFLEVNVRKLYMHVDIEKKESQDRSLGNVVFETSKPALLIVTGGEGEFFVMD